MFREYLIINKKSYNLLVSSKRARLIRPDNFKRLFYYDAYNYAQSVKLDTLSNINTYTNKRSNYISSNNKSLKYSASFGRSKTSINKFTYKSLNRIYPMYMEPFFRNRYDINYCNSYDM